MPVRTTQLCNASISTAGAFVTVYEAPSGRRTILKDLRILSTATTPGVLIVAVEPPGGGGSTIYIKLSLAQYELVVIAQAFMVLNAGDKLRVYIQSTTGGNTTVLGGGAELIL